ncbi:MAG TPA: HYR domain-containing protein [Thermoanaerobaculia bacterium]|nr:HYR domain-containing protein [Thermoanaerobaculia bacterium]
MTPDTIPLGSSEEFIRIEGLGLFTSTDDIVYVDFDSGAEIVEGSPSRIQRGEFILDAVSVGVPPLIAFTAGQHSVEVVSTNADGSERRVGPALLTVSFSTGDGTPPVINVPELVVAEVESARGTPVTFEVTGTSANGDPAQVTCDPASGSLFQLGTTNVTCVASDAFGTAEGRFSVFVTDSVAPVLVLPDDISSAVAEVSYTVTATDALDGDVPVTCSPASGSAFPAGETTVLCVAHDDHFNYAFGSFLVTVVDGPPKLTVPDDFQVEATSASGANVDYYVSATGDATTVCSPESGSSFPFGYTQVNCTATNVFGSDSGSFVVRVVDTAAPTLTLPSPVVTATSADGAVVNYTVTATDVVSGNLAADRITCDPPSGTIFPIGPSVVNCRATDLNGIEGYGAFIVIVNEADTTPPDVSVANITVEATSPAGAVVTFPDVMAYDNVDGVLPVTCNPASGSTFPLGSTQVQCFATDAHGNTGSANFFVTVRDTTRPAITAVSASPNVLWPPNHKMVVVKVSVTATDVADPAPVNKIISVTSNQPINGTGDGDTAPDWNITGLLTVQLRAERAGNSTADRIYTITVESKDASGNAATKTVTVRVSNN